LDEDLHHAIDALRAQGEVVIQLPVGVAHEEDEFICDRVLVHDAGKWVVQLNA
jgi:ATP phosphoribosyltransferase regulatory subunit